MVQQQGRRPFPPGSANPGGHYSDLDIDLLKDGIFVPGITIKYLFQTMPSDSYFSLFGNKQVDLHRLLRGSMVGGPSIIFHRYHQKDKTHIRNNADKPFQSVQGYDANTLYLWAIMQNMPTKHPIIKRCETGFQPERADLY